MLPIGAFLIWASVQEEDVVLSIAGSKNVTVMDIYFFVLAALFTALAWHYIRENPRVRAVSFIKNFIIIILVLTILSIGGF